MPLTAKLFLGILIIVVTIGIETLSLTLFFMLVHTNLLISLIFLVNIVLIEILFHYSKDRIMNEILAK